MPSIRLIISEMLLWVYVLLVYQNIMSENGGLFLPGFLGSPDFRILSNIIVLSLAGAAGMAYFAFFYRQLSGTIQKHSPLYAFGGATIGQLLMELFATSNILVTIGLVLSMMGWGYVMAYILYKVATESLGTHFGRFIGVSLGTGAIIAYIIGTIGAFFPKYTCLPSPYLAMPCSTGIYLPQEGLFGDSAGFSLNFDLAYLFHKKSYLSNNRSHFYGNFNGPL
ncbi:hypothetical protein D081_1236 [Anaerovibrio sp. JC8]|uniref:hypothetical protein n=1 Tax=Anaerovibrio sp. JC8 TaxID=1240085 RepID=UPI000A0C6B6E|nr:hypothetical protein [Anaerovibrio sp. JC8]ORU00142.1 hypothetical protein D081_1236 [Anaerovibrio sp. JC8]